MNQVKQNLFWIICGVALVVELVIAMVVLVPADDQGRSAMEVAKDLDTQDAQLTKLHALARKGDPEGEWDVESAERRTALLNDYLKTSNWEAVFAPYVARYGDQTRAISDYLVARSKGLREPLASSADRHAWYQNYKLRSDALVKSLLDAEALAVGSGSAAGGGVGAAAGAGAIDAEEVPRAARDAAGFFTRGAEAPEASEHEKLTLRLHLLEQLFTTLLTVQAQNRDNAVTGTPAQGAVPRPATLTAVTWQDESPPGPDGMAIQPLSLSLSGQLSSLLAVQAVLERNADETKPIWVVQAGSVAVKPTYAVGERKDAPGETLIMKLDLAVLDFSAKAQATAPAIAGQ